MGSVNSFATLVHLVAIHEYPDLIRGTAIKVPTNRVLETTRRYGELKRFCVIFTGEEPVDQVAGEGVSCADAEDVRIFLENGRWR